MNMQRDRLAGCLAVTLSLAVATSTHATWSIVMGDSETKEVAVGTVTCLTSYDLLALVPVVVVGKGGAAVQAAGDFDGTRRPVIFSRLMVGMDPHDILAILATLPGHQSRQYGIADTTGSMVTFTGSANSQWAGGVTGTDGSMVYAIQGNILAGDCVVPAIEQAILNTDGDIPARLMAGMQAARAEGGDGRCSCSPGNPTGCGCPPAQFTKSGHIGAMVVARVGNTDDPACNASGCADGNYFMKLNVPFQSSGSPVPVVQLQGLFDTWRAGLVGTPDAMQSTVAFEPAFIPPNGVSTAVMQIVLLDWQGLPISAPLPSVGVQHAPDSDGLSAIGPINDHGDGTYDLTLTAGAAAGIDRFVVTADDGGQAIILAPNPALEYYALGDLDGDGEVGIVDFLDLLALWGPCPDPCIADLDGDGEVGVTDFLIQLANWG
ncbi:MAG: DUF1028 domain-containing protein [Planctomycetota bacterium]|jgi:hypothetical protein